MSSRSGNTRAYTYIDRAHAAVGNRWMERVWSTFLGNTTSLMQKDGEFEWLARRSAEYRVDAAGETFEVIDFGDTSWSEENSPRGATLVSVQRLPGLEIALRTLALHDHPGFVRTVVVRNLASEPVPLVAVWPERLSLRREGVRIFTDDFSKEAGPAEWSTDRAAAALVHDDRGLFFGRQGGGHFALFTPLGDECSVRVPGPGVLGPGETWRTAPTFLVPFTGPWVDAAATTYSQFLSRYLVHEEQSAPRED